MKRTHAIAVGIFAALMSGVSLSAQAHPGGMAGMGGMGPRMMGQMGQGHSIGQHGGAVAAQQGRTGQAQHGTTAAGPHGGSGAGPVAGGCPMMSATSGRQAGHKH